MKNVVHVLCFTPPPPPPPPVMHHVTKQEAPVMFHKHDSSQSVHCSSGTQPPAGNLCSRTAECSWQICRKEVMQPCCDKPLCQSAHLTWSGCTTQAAGTQPVYLSPPVAATVFYSYFKMSFFISSYLKLKFTSLPRIVQPWALWGKVPTSCGITDDKNWTRRRVNEEHWSFHTSKQHLTK